jgi:hypothetical protein
MTCIGYADVTDALRRDPRLRIIPLGARALFILFADALELFPERAFCIGDRPASVAEMALLVSAPETEVQTHLETLLQVELLKRRANDGALMLAEIPSFDHAITARQNGSQGGRPRCGETAEQARSRRSQGNLKLPIVGGRCKAQETQEKPSFETQPPAREATTTNLQTELSASMLEVSEFGVEMMHLARLKLRPNNKTFDPIKEWLAEGFSEPLVRETIANVARRQSYTADNVSTFRYFDKAIRDAHARRPQPSDPQTKQQADRWEAWIDRGCQGPSPRLAA